MTKEQLIKKQAKTLRIKHELNKLTELECEDFIDDLIKEAFALQGVGSSLPDTKEVKEFIETESTRIAKIEYLNIDKESYTSGVIDCVNWLRKRLSK